MSADIELDRYDRGYERLGGKVFNRDVHSQKKVDYECLRKEAWEEVEKQRSCMKRAHEAYERGDGATAKQLSNEGKRHAAEADKCFANASNIIFEANNPGGPSGAPDTIDLHGLYVADAEKRVEDRIRHDQRDGKTHLHIIVGKGIHSVDHVQKIKPAIEQLCRDLGLQYATEENEGRIYVNLQGGNVTHMPPPPHHGDQPQYYPGQQGPLYGGQHHSGQHHGGQSQQQEAQYYPGQQGQHYGGQNQQEEDYDVIERLVTRLCKKFCCTVM
ncbi:DUF1771-domain-containing protein [Xylaria sp. FL0064]|nr:DUF1771-domain-containing protein [Xylaria sp. FL0064]